MPIRSSGKRKRDKSLTAAQQREAIHLWRNSGLSAKQIGERLGVSIDAIHALVGREL